MNQHETNAILLGKLLAETYRIQRKLDIPTASDSRIYALKNGIESAIADEIEEVGFISTSQLKHVMDVLDDIWLDPSKLANFTGFYDIEKELAAGGVDRPTAIVALTYLQANHQFTEVIEKMDSSNSPSECRTFDAQRWL